jgi:carbamoyltransferase
MLILAVNEGANASVVVCRDGRIEFALQEERVTRLKEHFGFPFEALKFTLKHLGLVPSDFDALCLSNHSSPLMTRAQFLADYDINAVSFSDALANGQWKAAAKKAFRILPPGVRRLSRVMRYGGQNDIVGKHVADAGFGAVPLRRYAHHSNHAASAYYGLRQNAKDPHLVLTLDGGGDEDCARVYRAENGRMTLLAQTAYGHSLGQIYGRVTHMMGMTPHEHEYKLMGMAPYADPHHFQKYVAQFERYIDLDPDNPLCFKRRIPEETGLIERRMMRDFERARFDAIAGAVQAFAERLIVRWVRECVRKTGLKRVVAAGGVFMNVKANKLIAELPEVEYFDVFPSCGDETLPFGAAWQACIDKDPSLNESIRLDNFYLGPDSLYDLDQAMARHADRLEYRKVADPTAEVARLIAEGHVVARASGRMEFGARALGNRSLLADPGRWGVIQRINKMIKQRDFWMPFAPAATVERAGEYVAIPASLPHPRISPYMMHTFDSRENRETFFAGTHPYDNTARLQFVSTDTNPEFHGIIDAFARLTGKAIVLNTSFNLHGHPVVMGAGDAMEVMVNSGIEYLMIGDTLVTKRMSAT